MRNAGRRRASARASRGACGSAGRRSGRGARASPSRRGRRSRRARGARRRRGGGPGDALVETRGPERRRAVDGQRRAERAGEERRRSRPVPAGAGMPGSIAGRPSPASATARRSRVERENSLQQFMRSASPVRPPRDGGGRCRSWAGTSSVGRRRRRRQPSSSGRRSGASRGSARRPGRPTTRRPVDELRGIGRDRRRASRGRG